MEERRICCFCEIWAEGGIESYLRGLLEELDPELIQVDIVAARLEESVFTEALRRRGIRFFALSGSTRKLVRNHRMFRQLLRAHRYDAVHLNLYQGLSLVYAAIARQEGVPIRIVHSHNSALRPSAGRPGKLLLHRLGRALFEKDATHRWACSGEAGKFLFSGSFQVMPNGISLDRFAFDPQARARIRTGLGVEDGIVLGNIGRLCPQKNQKFLLEVLSLLPEQYRLLLVGAGEDQSMLLRQARSLRISDRVIFAGSTDAPEAFLSAMDLFLLPSLFEGLPLSAVEAQAAGLPVLCTRGLTEELKLTEQVEFLPLEPDLWAEKILARNPVRQQDAQNRMRNTRFDIKSAAKQVESAYWGNF